MPHPLRTFLDRITGKSTREAKERMEDASRALQDALQSLREATECVTNAADRADRATECTREATEKTLKVQKRLNRIENVVARQKEALDEQRSLTREVLEASKRLDRAVKRQEKIEQRREAEKPSSGENPAERFYWSVKHPLNSIFGFRRLRVTSPADRPDTVLIEDRDTGRLLRLQIGSEGSVRLEESEGRDGERWVEAGTFNHRPAAVFGTARLLLDDGSRETDGIDEALANGEALPRKIAVGPQWECSLHRSGWGLAMRALRSLHHGGGVTFDGFLEETFCWHDTGTVHEEPWVGVVHNPPKTPSWCGNGRVTNDDLLADESFQASLRSCRGLFVLSEYHRRHLREKLDLPISVLSLPTETPDVRFTPEAFRQNPEPMLVQIGCWLRNPNSIYKLGVRSLVPARLDPGFPWEEESRRHLPPEELDLESVRLVPRLSDAQYDALLSRNVVFLDLIDSSVNNAIVECIVRHTPLLVNRIPAVVEYLGEDYPLYFESLEEARDKAEDSGAILAAHEHLVALPKERFTPREFLRAFAASEVYRSLPDPGREKIVGSSQRASVHP